MRRAAAESKISGVYMRVNTGTARGMLIETLPGYGKAKSEKIMNELQIAESRRLRGLGERQQAALLERLG